MNSKSNKELEEFAYRFLENQGAVLERNERGFEALLPENLSEVLGTSEHININTGSDPESEGVYSINYGSSLLEKMVDAVCGDVPLLACQLQFDYLKREGFDSLIQEQFFFPKSVGKMESRAIINTAYIFLICRYTAQSDEQKQGLVSLVFNLETGAYIPHMAELFSATGKNFIPLQKPIWKDGQLERVMKCIKEQSKGILMDELNSFHETMTRRFRRDVANLEEYYHALEKEMKKNLERSRLSKELIKERREKIDLLPDELERKRDDLFKKYSIKVNIEPCAVVLINTPAVKVLYNIFIRRTWKNVSLIYNPVTKALDPLVCRGCGKSITNIYSCNHLHLLCSMCSEKCPLC
ncbi:MAG: hypothetical protein ACYDIA_13955 [Candidatus Humimicrobiaceae bacterium]